MLSLGSKGIGNANNSTAETLQEVFKRYDAAGMLFHGG